MEVRGDHTFILNILQQEVKRFFMMLNCNHVYEIRSNDNQYLLAPTSLREYPTVSRLQ